MGKIRQGEEWEILMGQGDLFMCWWESQEECFWSFKPFSKLKTTICKDWTLIKIKISMTCVCKEYEGKMKIVLEQWLELKMMLFLAYDMKMVI